MGQCQRNTFMTSIRSNMMAASTKERRLGKLMLTRSWQKQLVVLPVMRNLTLKIIHQLVMKRRTQLSLSFLATSKVLESRTGENPTDFRSVRNFISRCKIGHTYKHIGWGFTTYVLSATNLLNCHWLKSDACLSINIHPHKKKKKKKKVVRKGNEHKISKQDLK